MAARQVTIKYTDGNEVTVELKPKHLIQAERLLNKPIAEHGIEASFMAAWKATRSPLRFDDWLDTVENLNEVPVDDEVDPTSDSSPDESPTSP